MGKPKIKHEFVFKEEEHTEQRIALRSLLIGASDVKKWTKEAYPHMSDLQVKRFSQKMDEVVAYAIQTMSRDESDEYDEKKWSVK